MFSRVAVSRVFSVLLVVVLVLAGVLPSRTAAASPRKTRGLPSGLSASDWAQVKALLPAAAPDTIDYLKASNTGATDSFGYCVSLSGDTLVVGSPYEASNAVGVNGDEANNSAWSAGAAYVFTRSGTPCSQPT